MDSWIECAWFKCRKRFEPSKHSNQYHYAGNGYRENAAFCSPACKQKAYRLRLKSGGVTAAATRIAGAVTRPQQRTETKQEFSTKIDHARPWKVVAGPAEKYSAKSLAAATIPDGPDGKWQGGNYERIDAENRAALRAHFAKLAKDCLIRPHHPPINILGGNKEWKDRRVNAVFADVPVIDLSPLPDKEAA